MQLILPIKREGADLIVVTENDEIASNLGHAIGFVSWHLVLVGALVSWKGQLLVPVKANQVIVLRPEGEDAGPALEAVLCPLHARLI